MAAHFFSRLARSPKEIHYRNRLQSPEFGWSMHTDSDRHLVPDDFRHG
jgi:hypothetical protein